MHERTIDETRYARAVKALSVALNASPHSEDIVLRLSTCRNVYLTVNALFVDIQKILGRGFGTSKIEACVNHINEKNYKNVYEAVNKIRLILQEIRNYR
jgi:hypothetical protein